jgi:hypothetical protein
LTLTGTDSEIVFSSIPATYRDLVLIYEYRSNANAQSFVRFNNDSTSGVYPRVLMNGSGSSATSSTPGGSSNNLSLDDMVEAGTTNAVTIIAQFMDYSATDKHKTILARTTAANYGTTAYAARYASTSAINQITISATGPAARTFSIGSTFSLYGVIA